MVLIFKPKFGLISQIPFSIFIENTKSKEFALSANFGSSN